MKKLGEAIRAASEWPLERAKAIRTNIVEHGLSKRMLKIVVATTAANAIMLIPAVYPVVGRAAYLAGITTAFGHPGRRFGQMFEALVLTVCGTALGIGWALLGLYLGSLVILTNPPAGYSIRALFLVVAFLLHGFFRSNTPRIFLGTVLFIIVNVVTLVSPAKVVTSTSATQILYPILIAVGIVFLVNVCIFPEFSSRFLGETTIKTLDGVLESIEQASSYFLQDSTSETKNKLAVNDVTASKANVRGKLSNCKVVQSECNFELAFSVLEPRDLKPISDIFMTRLTMNIIAMIGACESRFALIGDGSPKNTQMEAVSEKDKESSSRGEGDETESSGSIQGIPISLPSAADDLALVKPRREIAFGDPSLLRHLSQQIAPPCLKLQEILRGSVENINANIAYTYRVPTLSSGAKAPKTVRLEEVDLNVDKLKQGIEDFDAGVRASLEATEDWEEIREEWPDIMPREEVFLISSFYLNMRQAALHVCEMLEHSRVLVDEYQKRKARRRLYAPKISWRKWLATGGDEDQQAAENSSLQTIRNNGSSEHLEDDDESGNLLNHKERAKGKLPRPDPELGTDYRMEAKSPSSRKPSIDKRLKTTIPNPPGQNSISRLREALADVIEWVQHSHDVQYAFKVCIAAFLTLWPAFIAQWNTWYSVNRGLWAALQLVMITEPTFGSSVSTFILRAVGTTLGCLWGWAAYEARNGNRIVCTTMICIGTIPASYVIVGSKYVKAGIVTIVSITVIALATELNTVPGSATENFLKRFIAFTIGAAVALLIQVVLLPVKASTRMIEAIIRSLHHIAEMENCVAFGIESLIEKDILSPPTIKRFNRATRKAKAALQTADGLVPFCGQEPRLKGSFNAHLAIYKEVAFVMHQIIDRMDNMIVLRTAYGSGPLSLYNSQIFQHRRNLAASIVLTLFAVEEALTTHMPLPQFLPSCRLAQLRLINRVREVVKTDVRRQSETSFTIRKQTARQNWLSWNAGSMAQAEIVEYLEELCDLTKLLVGANEFRSGLLTRPTYREYVQRIEQQEAEAVAIERSQSAPKRQETKEELSQPGPTRRRGTTLRSSVGSDGAELPYSLRRIQSKRQEANLKRAETWKNQKEPVKRA